MLLVASCNHGFVNIIAKTRESGHHCLIHPVLERLRSHLKERNQEHNNKNEKITLSGIITFQIQLCSPATSEIATARRKVPTVGHPPQALAYLKHGKHV